MGGYEFYKYEREAAGKIVGTYIATSPTGATLPCKDLAWDRVVVFSFNGFTTQENEFKRTEIKIGSSEDMYMMTVPEDVIRET